MLMTQKFTTQGIMFEGSDHSEPSFPTLKEVGESNYLNLWGLDIPAEMEAWLAIAWNPRSVIYGDEDNRAMDETNWEALLSGLTEEPAKVYKTMGIPGDAFLWHTVGVEEALEVGRAIVGGFSGNDVLILRPDSEDLDEMKSSLRSLSDYPLLDESAYSERDWEAWQEYAPTAFQDELRFTYKDMDEDTNEAMSDQADELLPLLASHLHYSNGFSGEYGPDFVVIFADAVKALLQGSDRPW